MEHRFFSACMMVGWWMMNDIWMDCFFFVGVHENSRWSLNIPENLPKICWKPSVGMYQYKMSQMSGFVVATHFSKIFSSRSLGKWSNLTSMFFKWMVQPPTSQDLFFSPKFLRRTSSGLVVFDKFIFPSMDYNELQIFQIFAMSNYFLRHPLKRHGFGNGFKMILKDDLWSFSTEFSTHDTCMVGLGLVGRVLEDA